MKAVLAAIVMAALCSAAAEKKPDVQVIEAKIVRQEDRITVDGRVRVTAEKPVHGLLLIFDFLSAEGDVVSRAQIATEDDVVRPGGETAFHAVTSDAVRAVTCLIRARNAAERQLRLENGGPFPIE